MLHRPRRSQIVRVLTLLGVLAVSGACATWRPQAGPAAQAQPSGRVRLTLDDGSVVVLDRAVVTADSVRGEPRGGGEGVAFARSRVRRVEVQRTDALATAALVIGAVAAAAVALLAFGTSTGYD